MHLTKETLGFLVLFSSVVSTFAVNFYKIDTLHADVSSLKNKVTVLQIRQYNLLGAAIKEGWPIPQPLLGDAIMEGWMPGQPYKKPGG